MEPVCLHQSQVPLARHLLGSQMSTSMLTKGYLRRRFCVAPGTPACGYGMLQSPEAQQLC